MEFQKRCAQAQYDGASMKCDNRPDEHAFQPYKN